MRDRIMTEPENWYQLDLGALNTEIFNFSPFEKGTL